MAEGYFFRDLFHRAFELHCWEFSVKKRKLLQAMYEIQEGYSPQERKNDSNAPKKLLDYNDPAFRCAYLHKYAGSHADLVFGVLDLIHRNQPRLLLDIIVSSEWTNICCLGGGPGSDVVGMAAALSLMPESYRAYFNFTVVDKMHAWAYAYDTVRTAAESRRFGQLSDFLKHNVTSSYQGADIVEDFEVPMNAIRPADIVTMVKFISAVETEHVPKMLQNVFQWLKPGAVVIFIDNDAGGFYEVVAETASKCGLEAHFNPLRHLTYKNYAFKTKKVLGISSLSRTTVTVQVWRKPQTINSPRNHVVSNDPPLPERFRCNVGRMYRPKFFSGDVTENHLIAGQQWFTNNNAYDSVPEERHHGSCSYSVSGRRPFTRNVPCVSRDNRHLHFTYQDSNQDYYPWQQRVETVSLSSRQHYFASDQYAGNNYGYYGANTAIRGSAAEETKCED